MYFIKLTAAFLLAIFLGTILGNYTKGVLCGIGFDNFCKYACNNFKEQK